MNLKNTLCSLLALTGLCACSDYKPAALPDGTPVKLQIFNIEQQKPLEYPPLFNKVLAGKPVHRLWKMEQDGDTQSGVWESTPGKWRFENDHWEYCRICSGVSIITEDGGKPVTVKAGDSFVLRRGFKGTWEVVETTQKDYVIQK